MQLIDNVRLIFLKLLVRESKRNLPKQVELVRVRFVSRGFMLLLFDGRRSAARLDRSLEAWLV